MHDSFRLEIEGKSVFLKADGAVLHETTLGEFINQIVLLSDRSILDDPLPDGVRFIKRRGDRATLVVVEVRPQYRMVKWIDDKSPEPYGPDALYQHVRLAFPYIVLFVLFLDGELSGYQQAFYRTEPIKSLSDRLFFPNLRNVTEFRGLKCFLCLSHGDQERVRSLPWDQKIQKAVEYLFSRGFNRSSERHSQTPYWTLMQDVDPRVSSLEAWKLASAEDPLFPLKVRWKPAGLTVGQVIEKMLDLASRRIYVTHANDFFRIVSQSAIAEERWRI
jgi:hypothetical protein